jgi:hypothetical protein
MKTIRYVAKGSCKIKIGGKEYSGNMIIPVGGEKGLSDDDIKRLLKDNFICKLELEEDGKETKKSDSPADKKLEQKLIAEAK